MLRDNKYALPLAVLIGGHTSITHAQDLAAHYEQTNDWLQAHAERLDRRLGGEDDGAQSSLSAEFALDFTFSEIDGSSAGLRPRLSFDLPRTKSRLKNWYEDAEPIARETLDMGAQLMATTAPSWDTRYGWEGNGPYAELHRPRDWSDGDINFASNSHIGYNLAEGGYARQRFTVSTFEEDLFAPVALTELRWQQGRDGLVLETGTSLFRQDAPGDWVAYVWTQDTQISENPKLLSNNLSRKKHWPLWRDRLFMEWSVGARFEDEHDWAVDPYTEISLELHFHR